MRKTLIWLFLTSFCTLMVQADPSEEWVKRWNREKDREVKLKAEDVLLKETTEGPLSGLVTAGFRQTDGSYLLGRLVWREQTFSPLQGFAQILSDLGFAGMSDTERTEAFLSLLQNSYGKVGTKPYKGPGSKQNRPAPIKGLRGPDDSHRFQVWFYTFPVQAEGGEWREVLYFISRDGSQVKARTLATYYPEGERLTDFPPISGEFFE